MVNNQPPRSLINAFRKTWKQLNKKQKALVIANAPAIGATIAILLAEKKLKKVI